MRTLMILWLAAVLSSDCYASDLFAYPSAPDMETVARVVWGEVRGQRNDEVAAVCHVVWNRVQLGRWGGAAGVVTARKQFSALNVGDPNRVKLLAPALPTRKSYKRVAAVCALTIKGRVQGFFDDPTRGATNYWHGPKVPYWAANERKVVRIGAGNFVKLSRSKKIQAKVAGDQIGALIRATEELEAQR